MAGCRGAEVPKLKRTVFGELGGRPTTMPETKVVTAVAPRSGYDCGTGVRKREREQLQEPGPLASGLLHELPFLAPRDKVNWVGLPPWLGRSCQRELPPVS